jgi:ribonuclease J
MDSKIKLTFYGGVGEIGGNQILFEDLGYDVKLFIDFGMNFEKYTDYFEKYEDPSTLEELTKLYLLPKKQELSVKNLYSEHFIFNHKQQSQIEKIKETADKTDPPTIIDGIFISHPHRDHYYGISLVNRNIPIYTGVVTQRIILAQAESSKAVMGNFYEGLIWKLFRTGNVINIKGLKIYPIHVDHSIPAAYGFIFNTSEGLLVYSGDFRMHGPLSSMTEDLIRETNLKLAKYHDTQDPDRYQNVHSLIIEGTHIHKGAIESEQTVKTNMEKLMKNSGFDYYLVKYNRLDWDRFRTFFQIAKKFNWKYIISEKDAYFYHLLNEKAVHKTMKDPNIINNDNIYILLYGDEKYAWQAEIREILRENEKDWRIILMEELNDLSDKFFLYITHVFNDLLENLPMNLSGAFVSSSIDPYTEELIDNNRTIRRELQKLGIPSYRIHASGHAKPHDIMQFVKEISPTLLIPIHTEHPRFFKKLFRNHPYRIVLPERNKEIYENLVNRKGD